MIIVQNVIQASHVASITGRKRAWMLKARWSIQLSKKQITKVFSRSGIYQVEEPHGTDETQNYLEGSTPS